VDNEALLSCQTPVALIKGKEVRTIEGLAKNGTLHPLQSAFMKHDALQCGFCTPGMILRACDLLKKNPNPKQGRIIAEMDENLCRCGAHVRIVEAIQTAAREMKGGEW
jgi:aerobic-type carbon monoxide dehydrogenase small subunit (CoxS/CutS family)